MRVPAILGILLAVTFAGCTDGGGGGDGAGDDCDDHPALCNEDKYLGDHFCLKNDVQPRDLAPDTAGTPWRLGDWWTYSLKVDNEPATTTKLVYYDDQDFDSAGDPQHYMTGTPTRDEALQHAILSINPMIGRVHRILYSPHESGDHADMFHFPLCEGSKWTTRFFGEDFSYTAHRATISVPGMGQRDGWRLEGTSPGGSRITHTYSPDARWFTSIDLDRADGSTVDMTLTALGSGYSGQAFFLRGQKDHAESLDGLTGATDIPLPRTDGRSGAYDTLGVQLDLRRAAGNGQATVQLVDPAGTVRAEVQVGGVGGSSEAHLTNEVPYASGDWVLRVQNLVPGTTIEGRAVVVSIYDLSGQV